MATEANSSILGKGIKFPFEISATGDGKSGVIMSEEKQHVYESIWNILTTPIGSRFMRREFGSKLYDVPFEPQNEATITLINYFIVEAVERWEKRVKVQSSDIIYNKKEGQVIVSISVWFINQQEEGNMVFPFYLDEFKKLKGVR